MQLLSPPSCVRKVSPFGAAHSLAIGCALKTTGGAKVEFGWTLSAAAGSGDVLAAHRSVTAVNDSPLISKALTVPAVREKWFARTNTWDSPTLCDWLTVLVTTLPPSRGTTNGAEQEWERRMDARFLPAVVFPKQISYRLILLWSGFSVVFYFVFLYLDYFLRYEYYS